MIKRKLSKLGVVVSLIFLGSMMVCSSAQAGRPVVGKTYDKTNYQEIEDFCPPFLTNYLKSGEFIIKIGEFESPSLKPSEKFLKISAANEGKYDVDSEGIIVEKSTGEAAKFIYGQPFPTIDPKNPKAGLYIANNFSYFRYQNGSNIAMSASQFVGKGGLERELNNLGKYLYFQNRSDPMPNPDNLLQCNLTAIVAPYDLRGTASMSRQFNDSREDQSFAYVPMLRRVRRTSAAARSDPFAGGDGCSDDSNGYGGKPAAMEWKFVGDGEFLIGTTHTKTGRMTKGPDGSYTRSWFDLKAGYETPGWTGATYACTTAEYVVRPVWLVEMYPKDPYYNYGRQILYVDKEAYNAWYKEIYDRSGEYWKTTNVFWDFQKADDGETFMMSTLYIHLDWKTHHAGFSLVINSEQSKGEYRISSDKLNADHYTTSALIQLSK